MYQCATPAVVPYEEDVPAAEDSHGFQARGLEVDHFQRVVIREGCIVVEIAPVGHGLKQVYEQRLRAKSQDTTHLPDSGDGGNIWELGIYSHWPL